MTSIAVIGAGQWGTALAALLAGKGCEVLLWAREPEVLASVRSSRRNALFLPDLTLPENLTAVGDLAAVRGADLLVVAVPSRWMRPMAREMAASLGVGMPPLLSVTKGLEIATGKRMSEVLREELGACRIAALSGPNLAPEVAKGFPAATVIASEDEGLVNFAQECFSTPNFRPYTSGDLIGVEICGAMKNVIAIAGGICEGLGYGDNAKAALLTRAMSEIARLVTRLGGHEETVAGLSGIGDLITTCYSPMSRNHRVGLAVGRGEDFRAALGDSGQVAEGVPTTEAVVLLARRLGVELPICEQVFAMLFEGCGAAESVRALMSRAHRGELSV